MITLSSRETVQHEVDGVPYTIQVPTIYSRAAFRRDVSALGAVYHSTESMLNCLRDGIKECVIKEQQGELTELVDSFEYETSQRLKDKDFDDESYQRLAVQVAQIEEFMRTEYPRYAQMEADRGYWLSMAPVVAFRHFCRGTPELKPTLTAQKIMDEKSLEQFSDNHILAVGWHIIGLMNPSKDEEKNSESPPPSRPGRKTLTAGATRRTKAQAGKSAE